MLSVWSQRSVYWVCGMLQHDESRNNKKSQNVRERFSWRWLWSTQQWFLFVTRLSGGSRGLWGRVIMKYRTPFRTWCGAFEIPVDSILCVYRMSVRRQLTNSDDAKSYDIFCPPKTIWLLTIDQISLSSQYLMNLYCYFSMNLSHVSEISLEALKQHWRVSRFDYLKQVSRSL